MSTIPEIAPENEQFIRAAVAGGVFPSRSKAIDRAVELLRKRQQAAERTLVTRVTELERENSQLLAALQSLRERNAELENRPVPPGFAAEFASVIYRIANLTERIFPGEFSIESQCDPDEPDYPWIVFIVRTKGSYADSREQRIAWHDEVRRIVPEVAGEIRLCVLCAP